MSGSSHFASTAGKGSPTTAAALNAPALLPRSLQQDRPAVPQTKGMRSCHCLESVPPATFPQGPFLLSGLRAEGGHVGQALADHPAQRAASCLPRVPGLRRNLAVLQFPVRAGALTAALRNWNCGEGDERAGNALGRVSEPDSTWSTWNRSSRAPEEGETRGGRQSLRKRRRRTCAHWGGRGSRKGVRRGVRRAHCSTWAAGGKDGFRGKGEKPGCFWKHTLGMQVRKLRKVRLRWTPT